MGLANFFRAPREDRAVTFQSLWGAGAEAAVMRSWAGNSVTYSSALTLSTVYACVRLLVDDVSTLPADTYIRMDGARKPYRPRPTWVDEPDDGVTRGDYMQQIVLSMLLTHGACVRVYRNPVGEVVALVPLDPTITEPRRNPATGKVEFSWNHGEVVIPRSEMIYLPMLVRPGQVKGVSPLDELKQTLGLASALDEFAARFFSGGSTISGVIETQAVLNPEQALEVKDAFETTHRGNRNSHRIAVLGGGSKLTKTSVDPEQAQMLESRRFAVEEIARVFRVPLHMLQVSGQGVQSYSSNEENEIQYVKHTIRPIVAKIEDAHSRLLPSTAFLRMNLEGLQRGDLSSRFTAYNQAIAGGFMTLNQINGLEDWPSVDGGDVYRVPLENIDLNAASLAELQMRTGIYERLVQSGVEPSAAAKAAGLPDMKHTGLPSVQLQSVQQVAEADAMNDSPDQSTDDQNDPQEDSP